MYGAKPRVQSWTGVLVEIGNYYLVFTGLDSIERVQGQSSFSLLHITINWPTLTDARQSEEKWQQTDHEIKIIH